jgi:hypothetical protein
LTIRSVRNNREEECIEDLVWKYKRKGDKVTSRFWMRGERTRKRWQMFERKRTYIRLRKGK